MKALFLIVNVINREDSSVFHSKTNKQTTKFKKKKKKQPVRKTVPWMCQSSFSRTGQWSKIVILREEEKLLQSCVKKFQEVTQTHTSDCFCFAFSVQMDVLCLCSSWISISACARPAHRAMTKAWSLLDTVTNMTWMWLKQCYHHQSLKTIKWTKLQTG